jgi:hypothetical protein
MSGDEELILRAPHSRIPIALASHAYLPGKPGRYASQVRVLGL